MKATTQNAVATTTLLAEQDYCWRMHLAGYDVRTIAARFTAEHDRPMSATTAWRRIEHQREELRVSIRRQAVESLDVELARLDQQQTEWQAQVGRAQASIAQAYAIGVVFDEKAEDRLSKALLGLLRVSERRAKLLGLDAAVQVEHSGTVEVVDAEAAELARILDAAAQHAEAERERAQS